MARIGGPALRSRKAAAVEPHLVDLPIEGGIRVVALRPFRLIGEEKFKDEGARLLGTRSRGAHAHAGGGTPHA